jgi:hypothetical protein
MGAVNDALAQAVDLVRREPGAALLIAAGAYLLLLVLILWTLVRYARMARRQARLLRGTEGTNLERMLMEHLDGADAVRREIARAAEQGTSNQSSLRLCLQRVGLVRYDAFPDMGGEQSFSAALLDAEGNGLVVSGLVSRRDMRVYAKPVTRGVSPLSLTDEEREAISGARAGGPVAADTPMPSSGRAR